MATTYSSIYDEFLDRITDPDLLLLIEADEGATIQSYMEYAVRECARYVSPTFDLSDRTTVELDETDSRYDENSDDNTEPAFSDDLDNEVITMIIEYMVLAWLKPYHNNADLLRLHMNTKDFNTTSPANLIDKIGVRYDEARRRARSLRNEYTFITNDISNLSTTKKK